MKKINKAIVASFIALSLFNQTSVKADDSSEVDIKSIKFPPLHDVAVPEVEKVILDNGLKIFILEDHSLPLLDISVRINIGSYLEPQNQIGLSDIVGDQLREGGTEKWTPDELDELLESTGASVETYGDITFSHLGLNTLSSQKEQAIDLIDQVLRHPRFAQERLDQAMVSYKAGISRRNDNPTGIAKREFNKMIYGKGSVYAAQTEYAHLNNIKRQDLIDFHKKYYKPEFVMMSVCGDFNKAEMLNLLKKTFNSWERGNETIPANPEVKYEFDQRVGYVEVKDAKQANIFFGHIGGIASDEDEPKRIVMNNILGGGFGSRYFNQIRSKAGLCYQVYGNYDSNFAYPAMFINLTSTNCNTAVKATKMMIEEIKRLQNEEVTEAELDYGKQPYLNHFVFNFASKEAIVGRMLSYDLFGLPADHLQRQKKAVEATTAADVKAMAKKYLNPDKLRIIVCGDKELFDEPLENLNNGPVETIDITIPEDK